jgi:uncharacterized protein YaaN involved in tellurite resistance
MPVQEQIQPPTQTAAIDQRPLQLPQDDQIKKDLGLVSVDKPAAVVDPVLQKMADEWTAKLIKAGNTTDLAEQDKLRASVENIGSDTERRLAQRGKNGLLNQQVRTLVNSVEGGSVGKSLLDLKVQVDRINPNRVNILEPGGKGRLLAWLPFVGIPLDKYVTKWEQAGPVIDSIIQSIHDGAEELRRDNDVLRDEQISMRGETIRLQKVIQIAMLVNDQLTAAISKMEPGSEQRRFMELEILSTLRQKITDLQLSLSVNQNGFLAYNYTVLTNRELMRGAHRCETVTKQALDIAVTLSVALMRQKRELEGIKAVDKTTSDLIVQTSEQLKTQGAEIYKMAAGQSISIETLKTAYANIEAAYNERERFIQEALPEMASRILTMNQMSAHAEEKIRQLERGDKQRAAVEFDLQPTGAKNS